MNPLQKEVQEALQRVVDILTETQTTEECERLKQEVKSLRKETEILKNIIKDKTRANVELAQALANSESTIYDLERLNKELLAQLQNIEAAKPLWLPAYWTRDGESTVVVLRKMRESYLPYLEE